MDDDRYTLVRWAVVCDGPNFYVIERRPGEGSTDQWGPCESEEMANDLIAERRAMFERMIKNKIGALSDGTNT